MFYFNHTSGKFKEIKKKCEIHYLLPFYVSDNVNITSRKCESKSNDIIYNYYNSDIKHNNYKELRNDILNSSFETVIKKLTSSNLDSIKNPILEEAINNHEVREIDHYEQIKIFDDYSVNFTSEKFDTLDKRKNIFRMDVIIACKILLEINSGNYRYFSEHKNYVDGFAIYEIDRILILLAFMKKDLDLIEKILEHIIVEPNNIYTFGDEMDAENFSVLVKFQFENIYKRRTKFAKIFFILSGIDHIKLMIDAGIKFKKSDNIIFSLRKNNINEKDIYNVYDFIIDNNIGTDNLVGFAIRRSSYDDVKYLLDMGCRPPIDEMLDISLACATDSKIFARQIKTLVILIQNYYPRLNTGKLYNSLVQIIKYCSLDEFIEILDEFKIDINNKIYYTSNIYAMEIIYIKHNKILPSRNIYDVITIYCFYCVLSGRTDIFEYLLSLCNNKIEAAENILSTTLFQIYMYIDFLKIILSKVKIEEIWRSMKKIINETIILNNFNNYRIISEYMNYCQIEEILLGCHDNYKYYIGIYGKVFPEILLEHCDKIVSNIINSSPIDFESIDKMVEVTDPTNWINDNIIKVCLDNYDKCQKLLEWCSVNCKERLMDMIFCMDIFVTNIDHIDNNARDKRDFFYYWLSVKIPNVHNMLNI